MPLYAGVWGDMLNGAWLDRNEPALAKAIKALPWVEDGIEATERDAAQSLVHLATFAPDAFRTLNALPWIEDGMTAPEASVANYLSWIAEGYEDEAGRIASMPFLRTVGPVDEVAVSSLAFLAAADGDAFEKVMRNPAISDGITDELAKIVAVFDSANTFNPRIIDFLLDPDRLTVEERTITTPLSDEIHLAIIRVVPRVSRSMDQLERVVREAEAFLGEPFPLRYVALLFAGSVLGGSVGTNFGTNMTVLQSYDTGDGDSYAEWTSAMTISHEVAHYYWYRNRDWVDEGASELMSLVIESARTGKAPVKTREACRWVASIKELEELAPSDLSEGAFSCNYSLGERFFLGLYNALGEETFKKGFRRFYLDSLETDDAGIEELKAAFEAELEPAELADFNAVVDRWYHGIDS